MFGKRNGIPLILLLACTLGAGHLLARDGVNIDASKESAFTKLVPAAEVETSARQQYHIATSGIRVRVNGRGRSI